MGILGKIFGGGSAKSSEPSSTPPSTSPPTPASVQITPAAIPADAASSAPIPARRERSKPKQAANVDPSIDPAAENATLLAAIQAVVRGDSADTRKALYQAILAAEFYLVVMGDTTDFSTNEAGEINLEQGQQVSLATIRDPKGVTYLPAFTDVDRMSKTLPDDARYLRVPATAACRMFLQGTGEGIVINPGQAPSGVITRGEAEVLAQGTAPEIGENGQLVGAPARQMKIAIGKLPSPPADTFVDAIRTAAAEHPSVSEIHLFVAGIDDQPPRQMIGVAIDEGMPPEQMHPTFDAIGKAALAAREVEAEAFDMMPLSGELLEAIKPLEGVIYLRSEG